MGGIVHRPAQLDDQWYGMTRTERPQTGQWAFGLSSGEQSHVINRRSLDGLPRLPAGLLSVGPITQRR